ncbi:MAG: hypothetical protein IT168_32130 [Bryobacterales bacterium]|nr:hypothetical protein [Bryobacterales bacterium]
MKRFVGTVIGVVAGAAQLMGQEAGRVERFEVRSLPPVAMQGGPATFEFISAQPAIGAKLVTGAPYSAEGVSEFTQTLADGTRINRKSSSKMARDSQGRTREERTLAIIGPWTAGGEPPKIVTITDPVAKEVYILNEKDKTVRKMKMPGVDVLKTSPNGEPLPGNTAERRVQRMERVMIAHGPGPGAPGMTASIAGGVMGVGPLEHNVMFRRMADDAKAEPLGSQVMEGLKVEGSRISHTIPAGEIGNDRALVTTTERWTSADLQVLVRSLTKDPQFGETSFRLTNISREEPAKALFQIPADYKVEEGPAPAIMMRRETKQ